MMACEEWVGFRSTQSEDVECREHPPRVKAVNYSRARSYRLVCSVSRMRRSAYGLARAWRPAREECSRLPVGCRHCDLRCQSSREPSGDIGGIVVGRLRGAPPVVRGRRSGTAPRPRGRSYRDQSAPPPRGTVNTLVRPFRKTLLGPSQGHCLGDSAARSTTVVIAPATRLGEVASRAAILLHPVFVEIISKARSRIKREGQMTVSAGIPRRGSSRGCRG